MEYGFRDSGARLIIELFRVAWFLDFEDAGKDLRHYVFRVGTGSELVSYVLDRLKGGAVFTFDF